MSANTMPKRTRPTIHTNPLAHPDTIGSRISLETRARLRRLQLDLPR